MVALVPLLVILVKLITEQAAANEGVVSKSIIIIILALSRLNAQLARYCFIDTAITSLRIYTQIIFYPLTVYLRYPDKLARL